MATTTAPRPTVAGLVERPRLSALLDRGASAPVTLICAPAGSGKTVLLSSWLRSAQLPGRVGRRGARRGRRDALLGHGHGRAARLGRDRARRPARHARARAGGRAGGVPGAAARRSRAAAAGRCCSSSTTSTSCAPSRRCTSLEQLLARAPAQLRTFVVSRRDPKLGLHRLRLAGELVEIRGADLHFTAEEAGELLAAAGVTVAAADVGRLHQRTEGWAAGLRLAAMSLARHDAPDRFVAEFSGSERTVADYLLGEVLASQPPEVRLAAAAHVHPRARQRPARRPLTGRDDGARLLHELEEANALVVAVDVARSWFRYHHLLADLLRLELRREAPERGRRAAPARRRLARRARRRGRGDPPRAARRGLGARGRAARPPLGAPAARRRGGDARRAARRACPPGASAPTRSWRRSPPRICWPSRAGPRRTPSIAAAQDALPRCPRRAATAPRRRSRPSSSCARGGSATSARRSTRRARCCTARAPRPASSSRRSRCSTSGSPRAGRCASPTPRRTSSGRSRSAAGSSAPTSRSAAWRRWARWRT